jgi:opacity protein-like surface antigen
MKAKIIFTLLITFTLSISTFSQIGVKGGFALGESVDDNFSNMHLGFDLGVTYDITEAIRGEVLFEAMYRETDFFGNLTTRIVPITVGADYRFLRGRIQPFVGLNLGLVIMGTKAGSYSDSESYFGFHPKAGVNVKITDNILIDATLKYHVVFDENDKGLVFQTRKYSERILA